MAQERKKEIAVILIIVSTIVVSGHLFYCSLLTNHCSLSFLWLTPDQQGDRLMSAGQYTEAAEAYEDPARRGTALYRAGEFEAAAIAFGRVNSDESAYNRGNALVLLGKYNDAVESYDQALALRPDWPPALNNRKIARLRAERLDFEGGDMTGGQLGADDFVFDEGKKGTSEQTETVTMADGPPLSDQELRALWLRRVQTKPGDFLRAKFGYQYARTEQKHP